MQRLTLAIACFAIAASTAQAQVPAPPPAVKERCATCHGEKGETVAEDIPRLAGQHATYLEKQLRDFQSGARKSVMNRLARGLTAEEIVAVARYYAAQPAPAPAAPPADIAAVGRFLHLRGNPYSGIPACKACHGENAHGTATLPRLAGQHAAYLQRQLQEFTQRKRTNDDEVMHTIAERLTALETRAVAEYLSSLP
jgi:cytochrome c553